MNATFKLTTALPLCLLLASCSNPSQSSQSSSTSENNAATTSQASTQAPVLRVAAAANLATVLPIVIDAYQSTHNQAQDNASKDKPNPNPKIEVTYASSGKLFAQINSGAPYDLFLSADQDFPAKYAMQHPLNNPAAKPFTYARGQLALYSSNHDLSAVKTLDKASLQRLFITEPINSIGAIKSHIKTDIKISLANPELAPYGASAKAFLQQQGVYDSLSDHKQLIQAENIGQAFQYAHTATTDYGFVALSQLISAQVQPSKYRILDTKSYPAILQDGIVVSDNPQATDFSQYLQSKTAQNLFAKAGYLPVNSH
ncbi:molybdate ABC transporter substrate-binding protein [Psychrobacter sp.]|uniref:molybdate ABC transporter substrate-binding protein n=1 Tax=Psychrobacter sp. TaxID=56811 RepID=UPI0025F33C2B|nr:molybdate ABC transporter substrate-binding protein [Psychrobacter sp.]